MNTTRPLLSADRLRLQYGKHGVLDDFSLQLQAGEVLTILGYNGVGKSSLLKVLAGLQKPASGEVSLHGRRLQRHHQRVSLMSTHPNLLQWMTLEQNIGFGIDFKSDFALSPVQRQQRIDQAIQDTQLTYVRHAYPASLPESWTQRAVLARCLALEPEVLLLDEPFRALDEVVRAEMHALLFQLVKARNMSVVLASQDIDEALLVSDRIILLGDQPGKVLGEWSVTLPQPSTRYVRPVETLRQTLLETLQQARLTIAA